MTALRTAALNLLCIKGLWSLSSGLQAVMHDIEALLAVLSQQVGQ